MSETTLKNRIQVALARAGARIFRNQVGSYKLPDGTWLSSGLCEGSSDLVGWTPVVVTKEMVGKTLAVFVACEVKAPGAQTQPKRLEKQRNFVNTVKAAGGIGFFASFENEAVALLSEGPLRG